MRFRSEDKPKDVSLRQALQKLVRLKNAFQKMKIDLVFVHGSLAKDALKHLSDIDIAVLFSQEKFNFEKISAVVQKISEALEREDIDLMVLNHASPVACMQVLCNGKLVYCRNEKALKKFRLRAIQQYLATQHLRSSFNRYMEAAILKRS